MLYSVDSETYIIKVRHQQNFTIWTARLSAAKLAGIRRELRHIFGASEINTSSWLPGDDWMGTPWEPIGVWRRRFPKSLGKRLIQRI